MADRYEPSTFEAKWRQSWKDADLFKTRENPDAPKFYGMDFFPYPSGAGLSVGHCRNYVPTDVICRMKVMQGFNVLHPMGFDAFGLPAENEAIKRKTHPAPMIARYADTYHSQMDLIGVSYDWSRSFSSSDPTYYKWTQWIFELLFERGLAYRKMAAVNWDPIDKTVLADEEIIGGRAERSGALVEKKYIPQWFFKITEYAQRLIDDLDELDWPEGIKNQQRNWIGRSEGVQFTMSIVYDSPVVEVAPVAETAKSDHVDELQKIKDELLASGHQPEVDQAKIAKADVMLGKAQNAQAGIGDISADVDAVLGKMRAVTGDLEWNHETKPLTFEVFTTRIDTVFGMTFCVLAPEHQLVETILKNVDLVHQEAIKAYQLHAKTLSDTDRQSTTRDKTGVFTGAYAINPANGEKVQIWLADYVLATYGTGAIMAVPGHDDRDFEFANKFGIPVKRVITPESGEETELPFVAKDGLLVNSGEYSGLTVKEAQHGLGMWVEGLGIGERKIQYKLRDWLISRQRYWGCPIPIIHTKDGEMQVAPKSSLPVELPVVDNYEPSGDGTSPLAHIPEFVNTTDLDGRLGQRETDTMGGFACSSWYFLRFVDPHNANAPWDKAKADYWMPVDCYVGGAEHAVMHLLYARFWTKVLYDAGLVSVKEPFARLQNQGQVLAMTPYRKPTEDETLGVGEDGVLISFEEAKQLPESDVFHRWARMSKSKGNVVTPNEAVELYGADALRMYLLFVAPFEADVEWKNEGMTAMGKFLSRIFRLVEDIKPAYVSNWKDLIEFEELDDVAKKVRRATHQAIAKVTFDIDRFAFNTYVSGMMIFVNTLSEVRNSTDAANASRATALALSEAVESLILLISPGAPHSSDELWSSLNKDGFTYETQWPKSNPELAAEDTVTVAVQVNGKLRDTFDAAAGSSDDELQNTALASSKVQIHLDGKTVRKVIVIKGKLVNIVAN